MGNQFRVRYPGDPEPCRRRDSRVPIDNHPCATVSNRVCAACANQPEQYVAEQFGPPRFTILATAQIVPPSRDERGDNGADGLRDAAMLRERIYLPERAQESCAANADFVVFDTLCRPLGQEHVGVVELGKVDGCAGLEPFLRRRRQVQPAPAHMQVALYGVPIAGEPCTVRNRRGDRERPLHPVGVVVERVTFHEHFVVGRCGGRGIRRLAHRVSSRASRSRRAIHACFVSTRSGIEKQSSARLR